MRIVSLNAWGGAMYDELAAWLPTLAPDVVCLQEVTRFGDVAGLLTRHQGAFLACDSGPISDGEGEGRFRQDFGIATFVGEAFPLVGQQTAFVHGTHTDHEDWPHDGRPRIAHAVRILDL
jgi:hypothetical protein